jgi:uncharacterized cupredoxin-like copper-binding protein
VNVSIARRPRPSPVVLIVLLAVVAGLFFQLGVPLRATQSSWTSGDEPFYLLTTVSLLRDGDLDLNNQYAERAYTPFFDSSAPLWYQAVDTAQGRQLAPHNAGLPLLIAPAYQLGGAVGAKRFLALLGGLAVGLVAFAAVRLTDNVAAALGAALALALSAPTFVYASQVYPEMPAALVIAALILLLLTERLAPGLRALGIALGLTALAWLGTKYAFAGAVVGLFALCRLDRRGRALLVGSLAVSGAAYTWFHLSRYGGLTPYAVNQIYAGDSTASLVDEHLEIWNRLYRLLGLWFDREFGLVRWAPVLLLAFPGSIVSVRRFGWRGWFLLALFGAQLFVAAFLSITMRGWWFPGRMLIAVLPVLGIWLAVTFDSIRSRAFYAAGALLTVASGWTTLALWRATSAREVTLAVDPFDLGSRVFRWPAPLYPLYTAYGLDTWVRSLIWLFALLGIALLIIRSGQWQRTRSSERGTVGIGEVMSVRMIGMTVRESLRRAGVLALLAVVVGSTVLACSPERRPSDSASVSGSGSKSVSSAGTTVSEEGATPVNVTLDEWSVKPEADSVKATKIKFSATNKGKVVHELVVRHNGDEVAEVEDIEPGETKTLIVELKPGTYELACLLTTKDNGTTNDHYAKGMHVKFTVE